MEIITLPRALNLEASSPVQVFDYRTCNNCLRSKINLTQNTFSFLQQGTKEVIADRKSTTIANDKFLILKSGKCLMTETVSTVNKTYQSILLFFTDEMLLEFLEKNEFKFQRSDNKDAFMVCQYDAYIAHYVQSLERISKLDKALQRKLLKTKFEEIMMYLAAKEGEYFLSSLLENKDSKTAQLVNIVESNKLNKLSLQELSFLCNRSVSTFKREFKKHYQVTPSKWFQDQRLTHAAFLLKTQEKRPSELYEAAGYENLSNFVQAFKKKYGITPKQFQLENYPNFSESSND